MTRPLPWRAAALALAFAGPVIGRAADDKKDAPSKAKDEPAVLVIKLPDVIGGDVELTIDGDKSTQSGTTRKFVSPPLPAGPRYYYTVRAFWEPNNYTKITRKWKVYVKPGGTVEVDMTKADPKQPDDILVRYVPTPNEVVEAMCKMAKVTKGDVVYDLGCGDGRIVVTAVSKYGAKRGVGVDIDPERIADSKKTAKDAKVEGKVEFRQQDVLKIKDLSDATVIMLYMGEDLNKALKPILKKTLKPGTRIVSHRFLMGSDWKPERSQSMEVEGQNYDLHFWSIKGEEKKDEKKK